MIDVKMKSLEINRDESINIQLKSIDNAKKSESSLIETSLVNEKEKSDSSRLKETRPKLRRNVTSKTDANMYQKAKKEKIWKNSKNFKYSKTEKSPEKEVQNIEAILNKEQLIEICEPVLDGNDPEEAEIIIIPRTKRCLIFVFIVLLNLCVNLDEGNFPAATTQIQHDLNIDSSQLGLFGSLQYAGNIIGCIFSMLIIDKFNRKILFIIHIILTGFGLYIFTLSKNIGFLYFDRIILGVFQAFIKVYCPVWVDQFGPRTQKTLMMAFLQIGSPFGVVLGYTITMLITRAGLKWQLSFIVQSSLYIVFTIIFLFLPVIYFSSSLKCINPQNVYLEEEKRNEEIKNALNNKMIAEKESKKESLDEISLYQHNPETSSKLKSFFIDICRLVKIKVYVICVLAISVLLFISIAIQFWTTNYLLNVMKIDSTVVFVAFVATCITAPTFGIIIGGYIVQKLGGYESRKCLYVCSIYAICAVICGIPITFFESIVGFAIFLWLFLFFGGCIVPNLIGVILSSLPEDLRAAGNSICVFFNTLIGFLPAPYVYGLLYQATQITSPKLAYRCVLLYSIVACTLIIIATFIREKEFKRKMAEERSKMDAEINSNIKENNNIDEKPINEAKLHRCRSSEMPLKLKINNNEDFCIENNDATNYLSKINFDSNLIRKTSLNRSDDIIENVSRNEEFVNRILDNSIKVNELKFPGRNNTIKTIKTQQSIEDNNMMGFKINKEDSLINSDINLFNGAKDADVILNEEVCDAEMNEIKFKTMWYNINQENPIEKGYINHTNRNKKNNKYS